MYDTFDSNYQVLAHIVYYFFNIKTFYQATVGIDFLAKTMYLDDRTVSSNNSHRLLAVIYNSYMQEC